MYVLLVSGIIRLNHDISSPGIGRKKGGFSAMKEDYITDEQVVKRANAAVELEIEKLKVLDIPVIVYDRKKQIVVRRNSDGTEVEVGKRLRKGRYSERVAEEA